MEETFQSNTLDWSSLVIYLLGFVQSVLKLFYKGGLGVLPQKIFTELGKN